MTGYPEVTVDNGLIPTVGLLPDVHRLYFAPEYPEFAPRTMWRLSNSFTSAFKKLDPIPQFRATAKLGEFLSSLRASLRDAIIEHSNAKTMAILYP